MKKTQFKVTVSYTQEKDITVWAEDEADAEEKACDVVLKWQNVTDAEATDVEEM